MTTLQTLARSKHHKKALNPSISQPRPAELDLQKRVTDKLEQRRGFQNREVIALARGNSRTKAHCIFFLYPLPKHQNSSPTSQPTHSTFSNLLQPSSTFLPNIQSLSNSSPEHSTKSQATSVPYPEHPSNVNPHPLHLQSTMEPEPEPGAWLSSPINSFVNEASTLEVGLGIDMTPAGNSNVLRDSAGNFVLLVAQNSTDTDTDMDMNTGMEVDEQGSMPTLSPSPTPSYSPDPSLELHRMPRIPYNPLPFHSANTVTQMMYSVYTDLIDHLVYLQQLNHELPWSRSWTRASFGAALADNTGEKMLWVEIQVQVRRMHGRRENKGHGRVFSARLMSWDWEHGSNGLTGGKRGTHVGGRLIAGPCGWSEVGSPAGYEDWLVDREPTLNEVVALLRGVSEGDMIDGEIHFHAEVQMDPIRLPMREHVRLSETGLMNLRARYGYEHANVGGLRVPDRLMNRESGLVTELDDDDVV